MNIIQKIQNYFADRKRARELLEEIETINSQIIGMDEADEETQSYVAFRNKRKALAKRRGDLQAEYLVLNCK